MAARPPGSVKRPPNIGSTDCPDPGTASESAGASVPSDATGAMSTAPSPSSGPGSAATSGSAAGPGPGSVTAESLGGASWGVIGRLPGSADPPPDGSLPGEVSGVTLPPCVVVGGVECPLSVVGVVEPFFPPVLPPLPPPLRVVVVVESLPPLSVVVVVEP